MYFRDDKNFVYERERERGDPRFSNILKIVVILKASYFESF